MKTNISVLLAGIAVAFYCSIGNAQIIYSNNFSLGEAVNINGSAPTMANDFAGGTSSALWKDALGSQDTNSSGSVFSGKTAPSLERQIALFCHLHRNLATLTHYRLR
jgi:hypothetical protein